MESFIVSQSEALLIGRCLELYLQEVSDDPSVRFTNRVAADIGSFLPHAGSLTKYHSKPDVPPSVEWLEAENNGIGYSQERPQSVFYRSTLLASQSADFAEFEIERIDGAKTLEFLVIELVRDLLDPSLDAVINTLPPKQWGRERYNSHIQNLLKAAERSLVTDATELPFVENAEEIEKRLLLLVTAKENQHNEAFECGRKFGLVEANYRRGFEAAVRQVAQMFDFPDDDCDPYCVFQYLDQHESGRWQPMRSVDWHQGSEPALTYLLQQREIPLGSLSEQLLKRSRQDHESWDYNYQTQEEDFIETTCLADLYSCNEYLRRLTFALGDLIGRSNVSDEETRQVNSARPVPREFRLSPISTADRIRGSLELAEKWLTSDDAHDALGPTIVASLGSSVEALARRNWPDDFTGRRPDLSRILQEHLRNGSDLERRFASTGINLYKTYRNPTSHDFDSVSCSPLEALFFFNGVRVLLQLSDTICASRRKDT
jgi:hypothetical protein